MGRKQIARHEPDLEALQPSVGPSSIARAERFLAEYDFDCAIEELIAASANTRYDKDERSRALLLLLEIHVDHLANDQAAIALEPALRALGSLPERAHELLGIAACRAGETAHALHHLGRCRGERVGEALATIARESIKERAWAFACKASAQLNALAAMTEPPLSTSVAAQCADVRRLFERQAIVVQAEEIQADEDLERLVREFAPKHPWLRERRNHQQAARMRSSLRTSIQRAEKARVESNYEEVLRLLESVTSSAALSDAERAEVETLVAWAEERRASTDVTRALTLASSGNPDAACRAYQALSDAERQLLRDRGSATLFETIEVLNGAFPERANSQTILRAAIAWTTARDVDSHGQWHRIAPHAPLLERVPAFTADIQRLRQSCALASASGALDGQETEQHTREISLEGKRFGIAKEPTSPALRIVDIAKQALRIGTETFVLTLDVLEEDTSWALSLWPCRQTAKPKRIFIEGMLAAPPRRVFGARNCACIVDERDTLWLVHFEPDLCVRRVKPQTARAMTPDAEMILVDDEHLAVGPQSDAWHVVHLPTGAICMQLQQRIFWGRFAAGAYGYRNAGLCIERLDNGGRVVDHFELPRNVKPQAIMESPFGARPIVLGTAAMHAAAMVYWQPEPRFFRAIEVFNEAEHGAYLDALTLPGRGIFILTRHPDGTVFLHELRGEQRVLRPARRRLEVPNFVALVGDPAGRRAWLLRRSANRGIEIRSLSTSDGE